MCNLPCGGVPATYLNSHQTKEQRTCVLRELAKPLPSCKLLYVTPEQLAACEALKDILSRLTSRKLISLFVVDEVCSGFTVSAQLSPGLLRTARELAVHVCSSFLACTAPAQLPSCTDSAQLSRVLACCALSQRSIQLLVHTCSSVTCPAS